jgi:prepilin-type N-terminal cleavage/methylation domain-containing protein
MQRNKIVNVYGFTLIEVLVSLVVFSLAVTVISEALFQSARLLTLVETGSGKVSGQWREIRSLKEAVANMTVEVSLVNTESAAIGVQTRKQQGLQGSADQFTVWTLRHPLEARGVMRHMAANLVASNDSSSLMVGWAKLDADEFKPSVLGAKLVLGSQFAYMDNTGEQHARWPVLGKEAGLLPSAILLLGSSGQEVISVWSFDGPVMSNDYKGGASFLDLVGAQQR